MGSDLQMTEFDLARKFLIRHGKRLERYGISTPGLGLYPKDATEFIRLLQKLQVPLISFETWRWYVEERGRHSYGSSWFSKSSQDHALALDALARSGLGSCDLVVFKLGEP